MEDKTHYEKHYSRLASEGIIKSIICSAIVGFSFSLIVAVISWLTSINLLWLSVIVFFAATYPAVPLFYYKRFRPTAKQVADRLDRLGLQERVVTMTELTDDESLMASVQRKDTKRQLELTDPKRIKLNIFKRPIVALVIVALLSVSMNVFSVVNACKTALSHDWGEWIIIKPATCIEGGAQMRACKTNPSHTEMRYTPFSTEHDWGEWTVTIPAGEKTDGEEARTCNRAESHTQKRPIPAEGTIGLLFTSINNGTAYSVSKGTATAADVFIPTTHQGKPVTAIANSAFYNYESLESIVLPAGMITIGSSAFNNCKNLTGIDIPKSVTAINSRTFFHCTSLVSIIIPKDVTSIGNQAFSGCANLASVTFEEGSRLETIGSDRAFSHCTSLKSIIIPAGVTSIRSTFESCTSLKSVTFAKGSKLNIIGIYAFAWCESLECIIIPDGVTDIFERAFSSCKSLESIVIPDSVKYIGSGAFGDCTFKSIILPENLMNMANAFGSCGIENIVIPKGIPLISYQTFFCCYSLKSVIFAENSRLEAIYEYAFAYCRNLESIVIPAGVTSVGNSAFRECDLLTRVYYGGADNAAWEKIVIDNTENGNENLVNATCYYYRATRPASNPQNYWRFVDGIPTVWE